MKILIKVVLFALGLALVQIGGFFLVGKRDIHVECMKNLKTLTMDINHAGIYTPYIHLTTKEMGEIRASLQSQLGLVDFIESDTLFAEKYRLNEKGYGLGYKIESLNFAKATITEYNGALEYSEEWKSEYLLIFFFWVQLSQENVGQS